MSGERQSSELNEQRVLAEIDGHLKAVLSVAPSIDFEARVLRRIEERATAPRGWTVAYMVIAAAAALIVTAAVAVTIKRPAAGGRQPASAALLSLPDLEPLSGVPTIDGVLPVPSAPEARRFGVGPSGRRAIRATASALATAAEPEVIVPPEHAEALKRFLRSMAERRIRPPEKDLAIPQPEFVVVRPLTIEPIWIRPVVIETDARGSRR